MHGAEIELKFPVSDPLAFTRQVEVLGFHLQTERTLEQNTLYDTPTRDLQARRQILRLRTYGSHRTVTHKRVPTNTEADTHYKTRIETESEVEDCEALAEIFLQLGYVPVFHYEKFRTEWTSADTPGHLVLDETPIGTWAELEGDPAWIDSMMERLGVPVEDSTTLSYGKLFLNWKEITGSPAQHMTFEACQPVTA